MDDTACAACGAETLLFECPHCGQAYCSDHELPHHACDGLAAPSDEVDEFAAAGFETLVEVADAEQAGESAGPDEADSPIVTVPFDLGERDAARETRPDSERRWPVPDVRGHPNEREETLEEWFRRQSLVGYTLKVGVLALIFAVAYFVGLAVVLYGFV